MNVIRCCLYTLILLGVLPEFGLAQAVVPEKSIPVDSTRFLIFNDISAGPYFTAGVSRMNEQIEQGWASQAKPAFTFGGVAMASVSDWIGFSLGLVYDARELYLGANDRTGADSVTMDMSLTYIDIQPSVRIFWLLLGLSFDFPMSATATEFIAHDSYGNAYSQNRNPDVGDLTSMTELRAALDVPLYRSDAGQLSLAVSGTYPLSKVIRSTASYDSTGYFTNIGKGPLPTVQAGISYQFDLLH